MGSTASGGRIRRGKQLGGLAEQRGFHQGFAEQDKQMEKWRNQRREGGDLRLERRRVALYVHLRCRTPGQASRANRYLQRHVAQ